jgi:hypothetical protein
MFLYCGYFSLICFAVTTFQFIAYSCSIFVARSFISVRVSASCIFGTDVMSFQSDRNTSLSFWFTRDCAIFLYSCAIGYSVGTDSKGVVFSSDIFFIRVSENLLGRDSFSISIHSVF